MSCVLGVLAFLSGVALSFSQTTNSAYVSVNTATFMDQFADCPSSYAGYCHHGTCRFIVLEATVSCICPSGFIGSQCQYVNLLSVFSEDPDTLTSMRLAAITVVAMALIFATCACVYACRREIMHRISLKDAHRTPEHERLQV
ncbi:protransforming growth factor alpha-like [Acipenser ruthenus]|uniref:protransforming growth factor alpha-like n=1 Tax=Acipenser ruthenus TaxID=7906 RepID=UPI0027403FB0|nr:protransforming growth factor alpha-like [Acipenser ruthenus]